jgi:hypothetical protein
VVQSSLSASPMEVNYRRIGDKIIEQGTTTLTWSSSNSDAASLDPGGSVDASGTKSITLSPTQSGKGSVDENFQYTLKATNGRGGSETKTVVVHMKGSMEPFPTVLLHSVFFPTAYPTKDDSQLGLVLSQQEILTNLPPDLNGIWSMTLKRSCRLAETRTSAGEMITTSPYRNCACNGLRSFWFHRESQPRRSIPLPMASRNRWTKPRFAICKIEIQTKLLRSESRLPSNLARLQSPR